MKNIFMAMVLLLAFSSCGKKSGGSSSDPVYVIDERLEEGTGTWRLGYMQGSATMEEFLEFNGDEARYWQTMTNGGGITTIFDKRITLTPTSNASLKGVNAADDTEVWTWRYTINGTMLRVCDAQDVCYEFTKQ